MEDENLIGGLFRVVIPPLVRVVLDSTIEIVECRKDHVHVEIVEDLLLLPECSRIHHSKRKVTNLKLFALKLTVIKSDRIQLIICCL